MKFIKKSKKQVKKGNKRVNRKTKRRTRMKRGGNANNIPQSPPITARSHPQPPRAPRRRNMSVRPPVAAPMLPALPNTPISPVGVEGLNIPPSPPRRVRRRLRY
jgi:hypothetical protein